jgi:hypothetical protein
LSSPILSLALLGSPLLNLVLLNSPLLSFQDAKSKDGLKMQSPKMMHEHQKTLFEKRKGNKEEGPPSPSCFFLIPGLHLPLVLPVTPPPPPCDTLCVLSLFVFYVFPRFFGRLCSWRCCLGGFCLANLIGGSFRVWSSAVKGWSESKRTKQGMVKVKAGVGW